MKRVGSIDVRMCERVRGRYTVERGERRPLKMPTMEERKRPIRRTLINGRRRKRRMLRDGRRRRELARVK